MEGDASVMGHVCHGTLMGHFMVTWGTDMGHSRATMAAIRAPLASPWCLQRWHMPLRPLRHAACPWNGTRMRVWRGWHGHPWPPFDGTLASALRVP
jgi:hypothetical protein